MSNSLHRRTFLNQSSIGIGSLALASQLLADRSDAASQGGHLKPHFPARARRVIFLCMAGGPSHLETFDYKAKLKELDGQPMPAIDHRRSTDRPVARKRAEVLGSSVLLQQARGIGARDIGRVHAHPQDRRRHRDRPLDDHSSRSITIRLIPS